MKPSACIPLEHGTAWNHRGIRVSWLYHSCWRCCLLFHCRHPSSGPSVFANPLQFDPDRYLPPREEHEKTPFALVSFGGGARMCIATNFVSIDLKALLSSLLRAYRLEALPDQEPIQDYRSGIGITNVSKNLTFRLITNSPTPSEKLEWTTYDHDFAAIRPVCGAFLAPAWVYAPPQSVVRASVACRSASRAIFHAVWAAQPVCQPAAKCGASHDAPVVG